MMFVRKVLNKMHDLWLFNGWNCFLKFAKSYFMLFHAERYQKGGEKRNDMHKIATFEKNLKVNFQHHKNISESVIKNFSKISFVKL